MSILQHYCNDSSVLSAEKAIYRNVFKPHSIAFVSTCGSFVTLGHRKYVFYINQVYIGATSYISVSCHNPPIMGYYIYGLPHFTPVTLSPISCAHSTIIVFTIYNEEAKWNVKNVQSVGE